jgi:hypothetical protein
MSDPTPEQVREAMEEVRAYFIPFGPDAGYTPLTNEQLRDMGLIPESEYRRRHVKQGWDEMMDAFKATLPLLRRK